MKLKDRIIRLTIERRLEWTIFLVSLVLVGILLVLRLNIWEEQVDFHALRTETVIKSITVWLGAAALFSAYLIRKIHNVYRAPLIEFAKVTEKVANGDFTVYIPPKNDTPGKYTFYDKIAVDFNKMVKELGSVETLKTDFFSNVSHEIKTPIAAIQNSAKLLQKDSLSDEQRKEHAANIMKSTQKLSVLISNILKLDKLEKQTIGPVAATFDLCEQLCQCILQFDDILEKKNIELNVEIEDKRIITADESLLEIAWSNLLSNAVKFTEPGGTITLTQISTDEEITVSVADTGCGMSEDVISHVFNKFYQGDTSHSVEGNGLGLTLVRRIIQLVDGKIFIESELGKGTTFTVIIPKGRINT